MTIENYTPSELNPEAMPEELRDLLPLALKWGIGDDVIRDDWHQKAGEADKEALVQGLTGRTAAINAWLDSFGVGEMSAEAGAFMYMMLGLDEMGIYVE